MKIVRWILVILGIVIIITTFNMKQGVISALGIELILLGVLMFGEEENKIELICNNERNINIKNKKCTWAFIFGLIGIFFHLFAIIAIIIGVIGINECSKNQKHTNRWMGITGIILGMLYVLVSFYQSVR